MTKWLKGGAMAATVVGAWWALGAGVTEFRAQVLHTGAAHKGCAQVPRAGAAHRCRAPLAHLVLQNCKTVVQFRYN